MMNSDSDPCDPALVPFLRATGQAEVSEKLGDLLHEVASPLVWRVLRRQLGGRRSGVPQEDLEDRHAAALLRLQLQLLAVREREREPMASFPDYVAVTAYNAVSAFLMARQPERTRLRQRVRYVVGKDARLALWAGVGHDTLCGLSAWRGRDPATDPRRLAALASDVVAELGREPRSFGRVVRAMVERFGAPCRFEEIVDALAAELDVRDPLPSEGARRLGGSSEGARRLGEAEEQVEPAPSVEERLGTREVLDRVWGEILELPDRQRAALLLNLRDDGGEDLLATLLGCGVATPEAVAGALGLEPRVLRELLPSLPLEDLRIAERLGLTRQQVINLRKSARLRLGRRMRGLLPGMGG